MKKYGENRSVFPFSKFTKAFMFRINKDRRKKQKYQNILLTATALKIYKSEKNKTENKRTRKFNTFI